MGEMKTTKGYKGYNKDLTCRGKQYEENKVFEEEKAAICNSGMHFCENPFDVLDYYGFVNEKGEINEFTEVEALEEAKADDKRKKLCTTKLKIGAKLGLKGFVETCVDFLLEKTRIDDSEVDNSGDYAKIGSSGDSAQIESSGEHSVVMCAGYNSIAKAKKGSWITLAEWVKGSDGNFIPVCVKTEQVDGERIKEDTFYKLENGKFMEVENEK